jgi:isoleucyl-tRNA synthetase
LDGKGRKMSKSLGNVIAPQEITKKFGAEILRLWVSAEDYREDVRISNEILNRLVEAYRRLRNTGRFLISNLYDFHPAKDALRREELDELDRWILHRTETVLGRCREAYENYEFHAVYHTLNNFCSVDLSALYLDIVKDRLYCEGAGSKKRRAAQTALFRILDVLVHLMAPILSFTAEEIWGYMPDKEQRPSSVFLSQIPQPDTEFIDPDLAEEWERIFKERAEVLKALEEARNLGIIGHSLDAKVALYPQLYKKSEAAFWRDGAGIDPRDVLIVSCLDLNGTEDPGDTSEESLRALDGGAEPFGGPDETAVRNRGIRYGSPLFGGPIVVTKAAGEKCERCWKYDTGVGTDQAHPTVCPRCAAVLQSGVSG